MASTTDTDPIAAALDAAGIPYQAEFTPAITISLPDGSTLCVAEEEEAPGYYVTLYPDWASSDEHEEIAFEISPDEVVALAEMEIEVAGSAR